MEETDQTNDYDGDAQTGEGGGAKNFGCKKKNRIGLFITFFRGAITVPTLVESGNDMVRLGACKIVSIR